ncbi:MAG: hypothetical protein ABIE07_05970 [Candidatus Zixiibacteriota bacterium]
MADVYRINTGKLQQLPFQCAHGNHCWVRRAFSLQEKYFDALKKLEAENVKWKTRLESAEFLHEVAKAAAGAKGIDKEDVWGNMRPSMGRSDDPSEYEHTYLNEDIKRMHAAIKNQRKAAEESSGKLIACLKNKKFQKHLVTYHANFQISPQTAADVYGAVLEPQSSGGKILYREMDHFLALLTEHLTATKKGTDFLELVLKKDWVESNIAFADLWGYTAKINALTEPVGKFFYNASPIIVAKIQELINEKKVKDIGQILNDPDLKRHFGFLKDKLKFDVSKLLKKRADKFAGKASRARKYLERQSDWKKSVKQFQDVMDDAEAQTQLNNAWMGVTLDTVAFAISLVKIVADFKEAKWQDWMGLVGDFTGLVKTTAEIRQAQVLLVSGKGQSHQAAKAFAKRLGVLAGIASVIIMCGEIYKGIKGSDWDKVALNAAGIAITGVGMYAAFMEMALLSGICTVLAIVLAIITALVVDPEIIDYIEDTYWGEDYKDREIPIGKTIHEYYKRMFKMYLFFKIDEYDSNDSHILIECGMMTDTTPIFLEIIEEKGKRLLGRERIFPINKDVSGMGKVAKDKPSWDKNWPFYAKQLRIYKPWDIWAGENGIKRDNSTIYTIKGGIDPSRDKKMKIEQMAQYKTIDGVVFPVVQKPILWSNPPANESFYGSQVSYTGHQSTQYIPYPSGGKVDVHVFTRYGSGCEINIKATEDRTWPVPNRSISNIKAPVKKDKTIVPVPIKAPPSDNYYELWIKITLADSKGKPVKTISPQNVRIAYRNYIEKLRKS